MHPAEIPTDKCHLLTIPPEVRDSILKYLLISPEPLAYKTVTDDYPVSAGDNIIVPLAIACTCKQLLWEAVPIYYTKNSFHFQDSSSLHRFLKNIGSERRALLKDIAIAMHRVADFGPRGEDLTRKSPPKAMALLSQTGPLNKLTILVSACASWGPSNRFFHQPGVQGLRNVRGCKIFCVIWDCRCLGGHASDVRMQDEKREFEEVLKEEICAKGETETEKKERIIAEKKQAREDRKASLRSRV